MNYLQLVLLVSLLVDGWAWLPDMQTKVDISYEKSKLDVFTGNKTHVDYLKLLDATNDYLLLGGRNYMYNVSVDTLLENYEQRLEWYSSMSQADMCYVKGKREHDCQNYFRVLVPINDDMLFICGTNSGKPRCRNYVYNTTTNRYISRSETDGLGLCPYNPDDNTTAVYYHGELYTSIVPEVPGADALIYRKPQRTELSDFKSLNAPNFVSSFGYDKYVFFFYRETAVEFMNCGKAIYSRVSRVCKDDKGGPHQFRDRWTSFLKARLNCSIPGDYPFYFDEIQATSDVVSGRYSGSDEQLVYAVMTTPTNAIGGSAICAYSMRDVLNVFNGNYKGQDDINANWLPVAKEKVPTPRPGECVSDSRTLSDTVVQFIKTHPLMDQAVPTYFSAPILVHVSLQYRFTTIAVDPSVPALDGTTYDVLYIGTDDGKVLKAIYTNDGRNRSVQGVLIFSQQALPSGMPVTGLKVIRAKQKIVVVSKSQVRTLRMNYCSKVQSCAECLTLQDPDCVWDVAQARCLQLDLRTTTSTDHLLQSVQDNNAIKCQRVPSKPVQEVNAIHQKGILSGVGVGEELDRDAIKVDRDGQLTFNVVADNNVPAVEGDADIVAGGLLPAQRAETWQLLLVSFALMGLVVGFVVGFLFARRFGPPAVLLDSSVTEQHNHLNRPLISRFDLNSSTNRSSFLPPRANKSCNLPPKNFIKKDNNLDASKELNNSIENIDKNTLQKVKKTYI